MNYQVYHQELRRLVLVKRLISSLPSALRYRVAKKLYDYESEKVQGIDIKAQYLNDDIACFVNTKDLIGWNIFFFGEYEKDTNTLLKQYVKEGDVVIEAGANIGTETILLSKLVGSGAVHAFEPSPHVFDQLRCNILLNTSLNNVKLYDIALGESDKDVIFHVFPKQFHNSGLSSKYADWKHSSKITVKQQTLDAWAKEQDIQKLDFIKMDIQGAEWDLLQGAHNTILRHKPMVFLEAHEHKAELFDSLTSSGYQVNVISKKGLQPISSVPDFSANWLAIHKSKVLG